MTFPIITFTKAELYSIGDNFKGKEAWDRFKEIAFRRGLKFVRPTKDGHVESFAFKTWFDSEGNIYMQNIPVAGDAYRLKNPATGNDYTLQEFLNLKDRPVWHG